VLDVLLRDPPALRAALRALLVPVACGLPLACVFPSDTPTGIEFSWQFVEGEPSDGEDALRVLTCNGTAIETVAASLDDLEDPTRSGTFRFACDEGFQTATDLARSASEAFLELHPHEYDVVLQAEFPGADAETLAMRTVDVSSRSVTLELWEFTLAPREWTLALTNASACEQLSLGLYYADPGAALADETALDEDGEPVDVLYRTKLASDRGLGLAGEGGPCAGLDGEHRFAGLDRGTYRLEVDVDGTACAIEVDLTAASTTTTVDLAALPCG
jgi:hypothetical protein